MVKNMSLFPIVAQCAKIQLGEKKFVYKASTVVQIN